ncbi:VWA domain-containing protein [Spirillospora sp. NPDC049024]
MHRILRFQGFIARVQASVDQQDAAEVDLARWAVEAGYHDQAHLTRECRRLAGAPPGELLAQYGAACGCGHDHAASYLPMLRRRDGLAGLATDFGVDVTDERPAEVALPAFDLRTRISLRKEAVRVSLEKKGIGGVRARVAIALDASGSMRRLYKEGDVAEIVERMAAIALQVDDDRHAGRLDLRDGVRTAAAAAGRRDRGVDAGQRPHA